MKYRYSSGLSAVLLLFTLIFSVPARAAVYSGYTEYYIPGSEEQLCDIFDDLSTAQGDSINQASGMHTVISITSAGDDTTVYYDHWENGYNFDQNDPENTYDEKFVLSAGEVRGLVSSDIPCDPRGTATYYDGGDRVYVAGTSVTVSRTGWPEDSGTTLSISWELLPIKPFLTDYTIPVGVDLAANQGYDDFELTYVLVQSVSDNNTIQIDDPTTPGIDQIVTLDKGETTDLYDIGAGTHVKGQEPVQVHFIVGGTDGAYEARGYNAMPDSMWDNLYFNPVSGPAKAGIDVDLYLYNPHTSPIIIEWADTGATGTFTIPALSTISFFDGSGQNGGTSHYVPFGSGTFLRSDDVFWGIGSYDSGLQNYDWGYALVPRDALVEEYYLSWAPGTSDTPPGANGSPAYVTAVFDNTTIFVDYSPTDGVIDRTYTIDQLQSLKIFDESGDNDNTGMRIFATGPLAAAWGLDADSSDEYAPYMDLGTANLPMQADWIDLVLTLEKSADPSVLPPTLGEETSFTLVIDTYDFPARSLAVLDILPAGFNYLNDSTVITLPDGTVISGAAANPSISGQELDWGNSTLNGLNMDANETLTIVFDAVTVSPFSTGIYSNVAQARGTRLGGSQIFTPFENAVIYATAMTIDKDTTQASIPAGGTTSYTIKLQNIGQSDAENITITDDPSYPAGFSRNPAQATLTRYDINGTQVGVPVNQTNDGTWTLPWDLSAGQYVVVEFSMDTTPAIVPGTYDSDAEATYTIGANNDTIDDKGQEEQDPGTPQGEDPEPDEDVTITSLELNKTRTSSQNVLPGGTVSYRILVQNSGTGTVNDVDITDALPGLPSQFTFTGSSTYTLSGTTPGGAPTNEPGSGDTNLLWGPWDIGPGGSIIIDFSVAVPIDASPLTYDNTVFVDSIQTGLIDDAGSVGHWENDDPGTGIIADAHTTQDDTSTDEDVTVESAVLQIDMDSITKYAVANGSTNGTARYQIKLLNGATGIAPVPQITSTLPTGFTNDASSPATITHYDASGAVLSTNTDTNDGDWTVPSIGAGQWVIVTFDAVVAATTPVGTYHSDAGANSSIDDIGTIGFDPDTIPLEDPEPDEDVIVVAAPIADLAIDKSHTGDFDPAVTNSYSIVVTNNGPSSDPGTITVTDSLPAGMSYDSHAGSWNLTSAPTAQPLTFDYTGGPLTPGSSAPLTLNVTVDAATISPTVTNQVDVSSTTIDLVPDNNSDQDVTYILLPNITNSSKIVQDINLGDPEPGDFIRYVIRLEESAGYAANNITVTDTIDADYDRASFNLTTNPGNPLGTGGSSYDPITGLLTITGINLVPSSTTDIVFDVTIPDDALQDTVLSNSADIDNPSGTNLSVSAPDLVVQIPVPTTGEKPLYLYGNLDLSRAVPTSAQSTVTLFNIDNSNSGNPPPDNEEWILIPQTALELRIDSSSGTIPIDLWLARIDYLSWRNLYIQLQTTDSSNVTTTIGTLTQEFTDPVLGETPRLESFSIPIDPVWPSGAPGDEIIIPAGSTISLILASIEQPDWTDGDRNIVVYPDGNAGEHSQVLPQVNTVIQVEDVSFYNGAYPGGSAITQISPGTTVWVRAEVSDPFGSADITGATIDITDPEGTLQVDDAVMTEVYDSASATKIYEYEYDIPASGPLDYWAAEVTAEEGSEGTITDTEVGNIFVFPFTGADLGIIKSSQSANFYRGGIGNYTINVSNAGPEDQTAAIVVRDTIPAGLTYHSSSGAGWVVDVDDPSNPVNITWTYNNLPVVPGTNLPPITLTVNVDAGAPASIQNTATVDEGVDENNPGNNSSTDTVYILDTNITKTVDAASPYYEDQIPGNVLTYTVTITNPVPADPADGTIMDGISLEDQLPAGTSYVSGTSLVNGPKQTIRVTEYYVSSGFTTNSYTLTLDQDLAQNYFVMVQGSDGDTTNNNGRGPDENYVALTADPNGTGQLTPSGGDNILTFSRNGNVDGWVGVITVVESLQDHATDGFVLHDVARVAHNGTSTSGSVVRPGVNWNNSQTVLFGGYNGAGCETTTTSTAEHNSCHANIFPSGTNTIDWTRDPGGQTLQTATSTIMAVEWGSNWNVQRAAISETAGAAGAATTAAYASGSIGSVTRAHTWVWGTGHTNDNGIGDSGEGVLITLGNGVTQNGSETQVSVGIEYSQLLNFTVYALEHPSLNVDYQFIADGNTNETIFSQPVTPAVGNRMALVTNGSNGTGTAFPRPIWSARYLDNSTIQLERRRWGQPWPAWIQGIDFSGIYVPATPVVGGDVPDIVLPDDGYSLLPGQTLVAEIPVTIDQVGGAIPPQFITNTASVTTADDPTPREASAITEVRTIGVPRFTNAAGQTTNAFTLDGTTPIYMSVYDPDRNTDPNLIDSITITVTNPNTGDIVILTLYETGINTGTFANDSNGDLLILPVATCEDQYLGNCCEEDPMVNGCDNGDGTSTTPLTPEESLYLEPGTGTNLALDYVDPADALVDNSQSSALVATRVVLSDFGAFTRHGRSVIFWETASEIGTAAFNLLRLDPSSGTYEQVNFRPIPGLRGQQQGGFYRAVDQMLAPGATATYQLEEIERSGNKILYGPFTVTSGEVPEYIRTLQDDNRQIQRSAHPRKARPIVKQLARKGDSPRLRRAQRYSGEYDGLKIAIAHEGFYFLGSAEIAAGFNMNERAISRAIGRGNLNLSSSGEPVPYLPAPEQSGLFFYGAPLSNQYTDTNVYWLRPGKGLIMQSADPPIGDVTGDAEVGLEDAIAALRVASGARPAGVRPDYTASGTDVDGNNRVDLAEALHALKVKGKEGPLLSSAGLAQAGGLIQNFSATERYEENWVAFSDYYTDPDADFWMWDYMDAGYPPWDALDTTITLDGWSGEGLLDIRIDLLGGNNTSAAVDHHVSVWLNGYQIGDGWWGGEKPYTIDITGINPGDVGFMNNGLDILTVQAVLEPEVDWSMVALDSITVSYKRDNIAAENRLSLQPDEGLVEVSGFSAPEILVLDTSNAHQPEIIKTSNVDTPQGEYRARFNAAAESSYYAVVPDTAMLPGQLVPVKDSDLRRPENGYDYLVISPESFANQAQVLADYRAAQGLTSRVVTLEEIIDGFNYGLPGPYAIKSFLSFAWQNWQSPPRYVVLAGNGTYDYKDFEGYGDNHIPTPLLGTADGLYGSDQLLADVSGDDGVPDLAIGRLPADSESELTELIDRIIEFETGSGDWRQNALIVAESEKPAENNYFKTDSLEVASLLPDTLAKQYILQDDGKTYLDVISGLNSGALFMNFIGHGGWDRLANTPLLSSSHIPAPWGRNDLVSLTNEAERPVLAALTCIVGNYARPGWDYLGEAILKQPNGGAIAVWSPSGLSINKYAVWLNKEFARKLTEAAGGEALLGDLILESMQSYYARYGDTTLVGLYNLLGDPALVIPLTD